MKRKFIDLFRYEGSPRIFLWVSFLILAVKIAMQLIHPISFAWDAVVYIGMAKYIVSHGAIGLWEPYRPLVLPLLFSIGLLMHVPVNFWAQIMTAAVAAGALCVLYKTGEHYGRFVGSVAAIILASMSLFTDFALTPMTEVYGVFLFLMAFYVLFIRRQFYWGGVVTAVLFAARYPYGLLFPVFFVGLIMVLHSEHADWKIIREKLVLYCAGALTILVPLFVSNIILYGSSIAPFIEGGQAIIPDNSVSYREPLVYSIVIALISCPSIFFIYKSWKTKDKSVKVLWYSAGILLIFFTLIANKQDRFLLHVLPALILLAAIGIVQTAQTKRTIVPLIAAMIGIELILPYHATIHAKQNKEIEVIYKTFQSYSYGTPVVTTSPLIAEHSNVKVVPMYTKWTKVLGALSARENKGKDFYINTCDILDPQDAKASIARYGTIEQEHAIGWCEVYIGKLQIQ